MRQLELLRYVVEGGSLTAGARVAGVSQPAISKAMAVLAQTLEVTLFVRHGRNLFPTEQAIALARAAASLDAVVQQVEAVVQHPSSRRRVSRVLRAGLSPTSGLLYGPSMTQVLQAASPGSLLSISTGSAPDMLEQLACGDLDLVIAARPRGLQRPGINQHVMYTGRPMILCREGHPMAAATNLRSLAGAEWAVAGAAGTPGNLVEEAFRVRRLPAPRIVVQCPDYAMLLGMVAQTDLLGVVSHSKLVASARLRGIRPVQISEGLPHYDVCLFWQGEGRQSLLPGMAEVLEALQAAQKK